MTKSKPLVSIVVLSWNKLDETKACLASIRELNYKNIEVIVVDNGSEDGSKAWLMKQTDIVLVDLPENTGFTGGQLAAYKMAKGDYIALINNDAVVAANWIEKALEPFADPKVAVVGGRAYIWDQDHPAYDQNNPFYSYQVVDLNTGNAKTLQTGNEIVEVNSISGAGVVIRRSIAEKIGYFDDRFFAYYEETDLFARFKRAGYKVLYTPAVMTWHKIGMSTKDKPYFYLYQMHRNRYLFAYKNFDQPYLQRFTKSYQRSAIAALYRIIKGSKDLDDKAKLNAYIWNMRNKSKTQQFRHDTLQLGPSYSELLLNDANQDVTVVMPCYNYEAYVEQAIESALNQSLPPVEIIVINDGSTDNSLAKINKYKDKVTVIDQKNAGVIAGKNLGLSMVKTEWVVFLDADDYLDRDYIKKTMDVARKQGVDVVYTDMDLFGAESSYYKSKEFSKAAMRRENIVHNSALIRADRAKAAKGYKAVMSGGYEDWELYLTLYEQGATFSWINEPLLHYRRHVDNSRNIQAKTNENLISTVYKLHPKTFNKKFLAKVRLGKFYGDHREQLLVLKIFWPPSVYRLSKRMVIAYKEVKKPENAAMYEHKKSVLKKLIKEVRIRSILKSALDNEKYINKNLKKTTTQGKSS